MRLLTRLPVPRIHRCATQHAVGNLVHLATRELPVLDASTAAALATAHRASAAAHLRTLVDLDRVGQVLDAAAVPWLVLKGPVLAEVVLPYPDLRVYSDLDVLVHPERFRVAFDALVGAGADVLDRNWVRLVGERRGQLHLALPSGTVLDLHWHLINHAAARDDVDVSTADILARARTVDLDGSTVPTLDGVDTLLHLCLHAALAGAARLSWAFDVDQVVRRTDPDWDEVVRRAARWRARLPVAAVLARSAAWLGTPVPQGVGAALVPSGRIRRAVRAVARTAPREDPSRTRLDALVHRSLRDGAAPTARATTRWTRGKLARTSARRGDVFAPSGGVAARTAYLDGVAGWATATSR